MPSAAKTASNPLVNRESRSRSRNFRLEALGEVHEQVASGLGGPRTARVRAHSDQKRSAGAMLDRDQRA
jgi:hypothetical protein